MNIELIGVIIPVHDEEDLVASCLDSIAVARAQLDGPRVILAPVLDACGDQSASIVASLLGSGDQMFTVHHRNVGRSRASGVAGVLGLSSTERLDRVWLATTDADSVVPINWLSSQLALAQGGAAGVAGTVSVETWGDYPASRVRSYERYYAGNDGSDHHPHVHGANLGVRADAYVAAGGFPPLATGEDVALWSALQRTGLPLVSTRANPVTTSSRLRGRAPEGFAAFLENWDRSAA